MRNKWKAKVVPVGDEELAVELPQDMLEGLGWKKGDEIKWDETDEGITLKKITRKRVAAKLDDEALRVGGFIQELGKMQEQYFDALWEKIKDNKWIEGFKSDQDAKDWLFDYCFNGTENGSIEIKQSFSVYCEADWI